MDLFRAQFQTEIAYIPLCGRKYRNGVQFPAFMELEKVKHGK
jgi:hypothetical protein